MRRREFISLLRGAAVPAIVWPLATRAQQPARVARIGYLSNLSASTAASYVEAFRAGLRDLGYVEGKNFVIELRFTEGNDDQLPSLAAELVHLNVDVIVTSAGGSMPPRLRRRPFPSSCWCSATPLP